MQLALADRALVAVRRQLRLAGGALGGVVVLRGLSGFKGQLAALELFQKAQHLNLHVQREAPEGDRKSVV